MAMQTSSIAATSLGLDMPSVAGRAPTRQPFVGNSSARDPGGQPLPRGDLGHLACRLFAEAPWLGADPDLQERDALCSPRAIPYLVAWRRSSRAAPVTSIELMVGKVVASTWMPI